MFFSGLSLLLNNPNRLKKLIFSCPKLSLFHIYEQTSYCYTQKSNYVDVTMKWKQDTFYDSIEIIQKSQELRAVISLKNCIIKESEGCIPISAVSKRGFELGVPVKVASFLRKYPSVFEEFTGEKYNLPWFKLTQEAIDLDREEREVYKNRWSDFDDRLKRLILMTKEKRLPLKIIKGIQWYLGLPDDFIENQERSLNGCFEFVEMEDGIRGLSVKCDEKVMSVIQKNATKRGRCLEGSSLAFPLFPSKGLRLKKKISDWLDEFQKVPYVSPYEDSSHLNRNSDVSEKRVVGVLHELLSLFVDQSAERRKLLCLQKHLGLPQKFSKVFQRHPHIFYLSLRNKTCTAILKEGYNKDFAMENHPILGVRKKYIKLMNKSEIILKNRRQMKPSVELRDVDTDGDVESKGKYIQGVVPELQ
ncbi:ubiquitin carboxyl-terminal hydrolase family protein [Tasmannia lanceolata]|uniref:ubiquitin carboxyl-terminal hydrolase family protein n=1 Tax=Tasmannia lanceolata TaxID=3420 RepID=UPI004063EE6D